MVEQARPAKVGDVPLSGLFVDAKVGSGLQVGGTVEGIRQSGQEGLHVAFGALAPVLPEASFSPARQGLKDGDGVLQQDFDHRESGGKVGISTSENGLGTMAIIAAGRRREGAIVHLAKDGQDHSEAKEDETKTTD